MPFHYPPTKDSTQFHLRFGNHPARFNHVRQPAKLVVMDVLIQRIRQNQMRRVMLLALQGFQRGLNRVLNGKWHN